MDPGENQTCPPAAPLLGGGPLSILQAMARQAACDEVYFLKRNFMGWSCDHFGSDGARSFVVDDSDPSLTQAPPGFSGELVNLEPSRGGFLTRSSSPGGGCALRLCLSIGRSRWWWFLLWGKPALAPEEVPGVLAKLEPYAVAVALLDAVAHLDSSREQLELILRHTSDAIIIFDADNKIRLFNEAASRIFGYTPEEMIGKDYETLLPPEMRGKGEPERIREAVERHGIVHEQECVRWSKDGKTLALKVTSAAIHGTEGNLVNRFSFIRDLRPIKKLQEELVRTQSLAMVGELAASVAHEIRNPLASISAGIETLRAELKENPAQDEMILKILEQIGRLDHTVERLLTFAKPWEVSAARYDVAATVQRVAGAFGRPAQTRQVRLEVRQPASLEVFGDAQLLEHVLTNVLQNALEATGPGGAVTVDLCEHDGSFEIKVRDTGVGIALEDQGKLFRPFFTTKTRGTGLGLAICHKMVQAHKGTIKIHSVPGQGTEVTIRLPREYR